MLVLVFLVSLPGVTLRLYASDEIQYFAYLRSLWFDRDVSFENEYRHFVDAGVATDTLFRETFLERRTETGLRLNFGTLGSAVLWSPFYAAADLGVVGARALGADVPRDGYGRPYIAAVCVGSAVYGLLALLLARSVARRVLRPLALDRRAADAAVAAVWLGTPLVFYMYVAPAMAHATSAFAVALFVWLWLRVRETWSLRGLAALGAAAALMTMVREQDAFIVAGPAVDLLWTVAATRRWRIVSRAAAGLAVCAVAFVPQALAYVSLNGRIGPSQVTARKMDWLSPHAVDVLLSPHHGLFVWTPLAMIALAGLIVLARWPPPVRIGCAEAPGGARLVPARLAACFGAMVACQVYVTGAVASWTLAGAFGQRRFLALTVVLIVGLAVLFGAARTRGRRTTLALVVGLCVWWNIGLLVQFGTGTMDRQRLTLRQNAYRTFVTVPQDLPGIVRRYLFDRPSFYQAPQPAPGGPR